MHEIHKINNTKHLNTRFAVVDHTHCVVCRRFESLNQTAEEREVRQSFYTEILKYEEEVVRQQDTTCP